ncbi:MAG: ATP-binding protein [Saccharofermentanales bacterium]
MDRNESFDFETKREVTGTFLKTVSAFANYNDGRIIFGIDDSGKVIGIPDPENECLRIENMINSSLDPVPDFRLALDQREESTVIILSVMKGQDKPYFYKGKAYKRADTATIEVKRPELRRLALEGANLGYEERAASSPDLKFSILESKLQECIGIETVDLNILKTLNLYHKDGYYNFAAELLADSNDVRFSGIDIARFGRTIDKILFRETIDGRSLLSQYDRAMEIYKLFYTYEEIEGFYRVRKELIPKEAFREAVANAIVHRVWDLNSYIRIAMFEDKIEITSPGGLPEGVTEDDYLNKNLSMLRNPVIAGVFYRLNLIETFGSGVFRINREYKDSITKPDFLVSDNFIRITLPVLNDDPTGLSKDESVIYRLLKDGRELTREEIDRETGFNKAKTLRVIYKLTDKKIVKRLGEGPATAYRVR